MKPFKKISLSKPRQKEGITSGADSLFLEKKVKGLLDKWANKEEYLVQGHYLSFYRFKYQNLRDCQKNRGNLLKINVLKVS